MHRGNQEHGRRQRQHRHKKHTNPGVRGQSVTPHRPAAADDEHIRHPVAIEVSDDRALGGAGDEGGGSHEAPATAVDAHLVLAAGGRGGGETRAGCMGVWGSFAGERKASEEKWAEGAIVVVNSRFMHMSDMARSIY